MGYNLDFRNKSLKQNEHLLRTLQGYLFFFVFFFSSECIMPPCYDQSCNKKRFIHAKTTLKERKSVKNVYPILFAIVFL